MDEESGMATTGSLEDRFQPSRRETKVIRADPNSRRKALALVLTGFPRGDVAAVDTFLDFASAHGYSTDLLWIAEADEGTTAGLLVMPTPGRTALMFISPTRNELQRVAVEAAVTQACREIDRTTIHLVQALLEPSQVLERKALADAGFIQLATLQYLQAIDLQRYAVRLSAPEGLSVVNWSRRTRQRFVDATLGSYELTLDCPGLVGLRQINDILDGHMATGKFDPDLWLAFSCGDEPVGVMLLNLVPDQDAVELVYLGLCPSWRGRGLGRRLVGHAMWEADRRVAQKMVLAVDQDNLPAWRLYRSMGFSPTAYKYAMLCTLS